MSTDFAKQLHNHLVLRCGENYLVSVTANTIRSGVRRACLKAGIEQNGRGCHGFRHDYARRRFEELASEEQKEMMSRILENRLKDRKADHGLITVEQHQLYREPLR
ncbi:hypothetical protein [Lysinibacillus sp. LZ02]|uniref:hypothetical protein n=1 Tax=Lysinibacillus sp. LZ02 TaxID=3420668 RepID=UPI003D36C96D